MIGTIVLHKRAGPLAWCLCWPMRFIDPDPWVREHFDTWGKYWHMSFVCRWDNENKDWVVRSVEGSGIKYRLLNSFPEGSTVQVNWLPHVDTDEVEEYCQTHPCKGYDAIGYIQCAVNRLTRGLIPAVRNRWLYCWEDVSMFCEWAGHGWTPYFDMPYMPAFIKKIMAGR
jgi:hypothetical protein